IAPARRLSDNWLVELLRQGLKSLCRARARQGSVAKKMPLHALGEEVPKLSILAQFLKKAQQALVVIRGHRIGVEGFERPLCVPNEEMKLVCRHSAARGVPVRSTIPIRVPTIEIQDHKIGERGDIQQAEGVLRRFLRPSVPTTLNPDAA